MKHSLLLFTFILLRAGVSSQPTSDSTSLKSLVFANTLTVHPFGIYQSRINSNYQFEAAKKLSVNTSISNGNVWLPYVKVYRPLDADDLAELHTLDWYDYEEIFEDGFAPAKESSFQADGVIRLFQMEFNIPIRRYHELRVRTRATLLTDGKAPFSLTTNDDFIEWFHSNVAGGEDPFSRKAHPLNEAYIEYINEEGDQMKVESGNFNFSGVDLMYYYYPNIQFLKTLKIALNAGAQLGINTNKFNSSADAGLNISLIKSFNIRKSHTINIGSSGAMLRPNIYNFGKVFQLSTRKILLQFEPMLEYVHRLQKKRIISIATTWSFQNSLYNPDVFRNIALYGDRITSHWHVAISHLYKQRLHGNLILSYGKGNLLYTIYLSQDTFVDNAPDIQTGFGIKYFLNRNTE